jgi:hypothetical protein
MDRSPPSWSPPGNDGVDLARGTLRDALGALGNLAQLAGSTRVGSKAIENVLPDVLASTGPMRAAAEELLASLGPGLGGSTVLDELRSFVLPRLDELEEQLTELTSGPLKTPNRLGLDRLLARLSAELDAAQSLLELLEVASAEPFVALRPQEVLRQRLPAAPSGKRPQRRMEARLTVEEPVPDVSLRPRALAAIVGSLAEMLEVERPLFFVRSTPTGVEIDVVKEGAEGGDPVAFWAYGVVAPTASAVAAAASLAGQTLQPLPHGTRLRLRPRS